MNEQTKTGKGVKKEKKKKGKKKRFDDKRNI